jgi:CheY-like chemotaxis protein
MPSGGSLTLETFNAVIDSELSRPEDPAPGDYVGLAVNDTGVGIADDVLPRIFEPFFTTKEPGKGSGTSLRFRQTIGRQRAYRDTRRRGHLGEGLCAEVVIGDHENEAVDADRRPPMNTKSSVLVVDDDKAVLKSTPRMLESLGFAGVPAESGEEALRLIATEPDIGLVLADFAMPEMSGVELARTVHATRPTMPVILVRRPPPDIVAQVSRLLRLHVHRCP